MASSSSNTPIKPTRHIEVKEKDGGWIATKDIEAGDVILVEAPVVFGPGRQGYPACLGCGKYADGSNFCSKCGWQVCSAECEALPAHKDECELFQSSGVECSVEDFDNVTLSLDFVGPLRLLMAMKNDLDLRKLLSINTYNEERKKAYAIRFFIGCEDNIAKTIKETCKLDGFTDDEIMTAIGLFEMYGSNVAGGTAKALHPTTCFLESSCVPNSYSALLSDMSIMFKASKKIKKGERITRCYGNPMKSTTFRRQEILDQYMFGCFCERCKDPSEMGTYYGGLHCEVCKEGLTCPDDPMNPDGCGWTCGKCGNKIEDGAQACTEIRKLAKMIEGTIADTQGSVQTLEFLLSNSGEWDRLPKHGDQMLEVKHQLLINIGNMAGSAYPILDAEKIVLKLECCRDYLKYLGIFHPGYNYLRAAIIYEAQLAGKAYLANLRRQTQTNYTKSNDYDSDLAADIKNEVEEWCKEAMEISRVEEEGSVFASLREMMKATIGQLSSLL